MIRVKGKALSVKLIVFFLLLLYPLPFTVSPVRAADSTPSADIKTKLEELKKQIASKAAVLKQEVDKKLTNKAYVGKIKTKSESAITIASKNGPRIVNINQDTQFVSQVKSKKYSQKLASEEDYVAALGDIDENQVLTAKKIILLPTTNNELRTYLWGQIAAISDKLITLKTRDLKNASVSLPEAKFKLNDFVILTGTKGKNDIFEADFVYVIPQGGILKPKGKLATPSAKLATPSAKPKSSN